jgi:hypothetical protein
LAGTVFSNGATVTKQTTGIAINNFRVGGAQAVGGTTNKAPAAKTNDTGKKTAKSGTGGSGRANR